MKKFFELHIGIVEKAKETSSDTGMLNRAITVLHEQWMCPGMRRHTHITLCSMVYNNLIPISVPPYSPSPQASNQLNTDYPSKKSHYIFWNGTDIGITMLHSVMWVCLCIPGYIHCSCSTVMALLCIPVSELVSFAFSAIPIIMSLFNSKTFTCLHFLLPANCMLIRCMYMISTSTFIFLF